MNKIEEYSEEYLFLHGISPFTGSTFKVKCNERISKTGTYLVETTDYSRLLTTSANMKRVFGGTVDAHPMKALSNKALWLFTYLQFVIEQGKDYVQINAEHYKKWVGKTSGNTLLDAKKELCAKGFIASTTTYKTVFWINPDIFFPGNRINKYRKTDNLEIAICTQAMITDL